MMSDERVFVSHTRLDAQKTAVVVQWSSGTEAAEHPGIPKYPVSPKSEHPAKTREQANGS